MKRNYPNKDEYQLQADIVALRRRAAEIEARSQREGRELSHDESSLINEMRDEVHNLAEELRLLQPEKPVTMGSHAGSLSADRASCHLLPEAMSWWDRPSRKTIKPFSAAGQMIINGQTRTPAFSLPCFQAVIIRGLFEPQ